MVQNLSNVPSESFYKKVNNESDHKNGLSVMFTNLFIHVFSDIYFYTSCVNINGALSYSRLPEGQFPCVSLP